MTNYHVNQETGRANICRAKDQCPLGSDTPHFNSKDEAKQYIEASEAAQNNSLNTVSKKSIEAKEETHPLSSFEKQEHKKFYDNLEDEYENKKDNLDPQSSGEVYALWSMRSRYNKTVDRQNPTFEQISSYKNFLRNKIDSEKSSTATAESSDELLYFSAQTSKYQEELAKIEKIEIDNINDSIDKYKANKHAILRKEVASNFVDTFSHNDNFHAAVLATQKQVEELANSTKNSSQNNNVRVLNKSYKEYLTAVKSVDVDKIQAAQRNISLYMKNMLGNELGLTLENSHVYRTIHDYSL